MLIAGCVSKFK